VLIHTSSTRGVHGNRRSPSAGRVGGSPASEGTAYGSQASSAAPYESELQVATLAEPVLRYPAGSFREASGSTALY
jgi:hypothetical protein